MHRQDFFRRVGALEDSVEAILFEFQARLEYFFTVLPAASQNVRVLCRFILFFWKAPPRFFFVGVVCWCPAGGLSPLLGVLFCSLSCVKLDTLTHEQYYSGVSR